MNLVKPKVLFLTLKTFSLTGGIEKISRAFSKVLTDLKNEQKISDFDVLSMYDTEPNENYVQQSNFKGFAGKRFSFALCSLSNGRKTDTLILSHINLLIFAWIIKKIASKKRIILLAHGIEVWGEIKDWKLAFLRKHCELWAVSHFTAEKLVEHGIPRTNIKILNNCLDPFYKVPSLFNKSQALLDKYHLNKSQPILFTLARLANQEQYKGYDNVIKALKLLVSTFPDLHYILAGKADEMEHIRILALIKSNNLEEYVTLTGYLKDEEVIDHYLLADVFVMPSKGEGFGISFIEAAAAGCYLIAGNKDGSADALLNGELGILINPDDHTAIADAITKSLSIVKTIEKSLIIQSKCLDHFSYENYKVNILNLLAQ